MPERGAQVRRTGIGSLAGLALGAVLYVAVNVLFNVSAPEARLDVTENGLFTLSDGTLATLARIDEPIELHFFLSGHLGREVPAYASYGLRVRELLAEVAAASGGKVILREHDPKPFSRGEELAVSFGVQGVPVDSGGDLAYFGLAGTNSVDDTETVPFFQPEREMLLEYDVARMIHALSNPEPTVVGVMGSLPVMGDMHAQAQGGVLVPWAVARHLKAVFDTIHLPESIDDLPASIDVMMVVHPRAMSDRAIYELEQFLFRGGRALLFVDPRAESDTSVGPEATSSSTGGLGRLFEAWGIEVPDRRLVGDRSMALTINAGTAARPVPAEFLVWLGASAEYLAQDDPVTARLPALNLASAGSIRQAEGSPLVLEPLITSSADSGPIDVDAVRGLRPDVLGLLDRFRPDDDTHVLGARLTGEVATAFPDGPPPRTVAKTAVDLAEDPDVPQLMRSRQPVNVILVADADLLQDRFWLRKRQFFGREVEEAIAGNADFVVNALGNLAGSDALLKLRSRGVSQRPFERIRALERAAESRFRDKERELQDKLRETREKIAGLEGVRSAEDALTGERRVVVSLTDGQRAEVEALRGQMLSIRRQIHDVRRSLREDVESLEAWLQFANIGLVPIALSGVAILVGLIRIARRRRYHLGLSERGAG